MFKSCGKCNNGKITIRSKNGNTWKYCDCYKTYIHNMRIYSKMKSSGLNDIIVKSFDDYVGTDENKNIPKMKKFVDEFSNKFHDKHLFIYGDNGTQKSTMAKVLLYKLAEKGYSVLYMNSKDFFSKFSELEVDEEFENKFYNYDCLILDEFDSKKVQLFKSGYKESATIAPLKKRMEINRKSTIFISNQTIDEIKDSQLGELFGDLIDRECFQMTFTDKYSKNVDLSKKWDDLWSD